MLFMKQPKGLSYVRNVRLWNFRLRRHSSSVDGLPTDLLRLWDDLIPERRKAANTFTADDRVPAARNIILFISPDMRSHNDRA